MGDLYHVSHAIYCRMKEDRDEEEVLEPFRRRSPSLHSKDYHNIPFLIKFLPSALGIVDRSLSSLSVIGSLTSILGDIESLNSLLHTNLRSLGVIRASPNQFPPTMVSNVFSRYGI